MPLALDFNRQIRTLSNVSPEVRAIPQTDALASSFGRASAQQRLSDADTGLRIRSMDEQMRQNRLDQREANRDSLLALGISGVNTGMQMAVNKEQSEMQKRAAARLQEENDFWGAIGEIMTRNWNEIEKRLRVTPEGGA